MFIVPAWWPIMILHFLASFSACHSSRDDPRFHFGFSGCATSHFANEVIPSSCNRNQSPCRSAQISPTAPHFFKAAERLHLALYNRDLAAPRCIPCARAT